MAVREILIYPEKILRKKAEVVTEVTEEICAALSDMAETMYEAPGIGLAGPQIGMSHRILVVDISEMAKEGDQNPGLLQVINPKILESSGERIFEEGCLSLPGLLVEIERPDRVVMEFMNMEGKVENLEARGLLATVLQHEMDHLEGILIVDRLSPLKRSRYASWLKKAIKKGNLPRGRSEPGFAA